VDVPDQQQQQRVDNYAKIANYSNAEDLMFAISDISTVYNNQWKKATRKEGIKDGIYTIIPDELETLHKSTNVRWNIVTFSQVEPGNKKAMLTDDGKALYLKVLGPDKL